MKSQYLYNVKVSHCFLIWGYFFKFYLCNIFMSIPFFPMWESLLCHFLGPDLHCLSLWPVTCLAPLPSAFSPPVSVLSCDIKDVSVLIGHLRHFKCLSISCKIILYCLTWSSGSLSGLVPQIFLVFSFLNLQHQSEGQFYTNLCICLFASLYAVSTTLSSKFTCANIAHFKA